MTHEDAFLASIIENPDDDAPRLIYADWLEQEAGQPERAEFIRVQCNLVHAPDCPLCRNGRYCQPFGDNHPDNCLCVGAALRRRERELLGRYQGRWTIDEILDKIPDRHRSTLLQLTARDATRVGGWPSNESMFMFRRGFIECIHCVCQTWLEYGPAMIKAASTIREVRLTDKRAEAIQGERRWFFQCYPGDHYAMMHKSFSLPVPIFHHMPPASCFNKNECIFDSPDHAAQGLSQACLAYASQELIRRHHWQELFSTVGPPK